jgi:hypothetical protein
MTAADNGYQVGLTGTQREALSRRVARGGAVMRMTPPSTLVMRQIVTNTPMHIYSPQYAQQLMADEWAHLAPIIDYIQNSGGARWACMLALCDLVHMDRVLSPREYRVWQVAVEHELGPDVTRDQAQQLCNAAGLANAAAAAVDLLAWCQPGLAELARHVLAPFARFCMSNMPRDVFVASAEERDMTGKPYWEHVLKFAVAAASIQDRGAPPAVDVATLGDMECATIFEQMAALCDMGTVIDGNDIPARRNALRDMYDNAGDVDQQPARLGANARLGAFAIAAIVGCLPATREVFEMLLSLGLLPSMTVAAPMSAQVHYGVQVMSSSTTAFTTDLDVRTTPGSGFTQGDLYAVAGTFGSYTYPTPLNTKAAVYVTNLSVNMRRAVLRMSGFSRKWTLIKQRAWFANPACLQNCRTMTSTTLTDIPCATSPSPRGCRCRRAAPPHVTRRVTRTPACCKAPGWCSGVYLSVYRTGRVRRRTPTSLCKYDIVTYTSSKTTCRTSVSQSYAMTTVCVTSGMHGPMSVVMTISAAPITGRRQQLTMYTHTTA